MKLSTSNSDMLSINDTNALKGLALILLLIHHLFYVQNGLYNDIQLYKSIYLVQEVGMFGKLCVVMFAFLSGYGLMAQAEIKGGLGNIKEWYIRRYKKLMLSYWVIWLIFVPISYFCFDMTFEKAYHHDVALQFVLDILGIHDVFYTGSVFCYNPTWWFMSCIILLYLMFPVMYRMINKDMLSLLMLTLIVSFLPIPNLGILQFNIVAFFLGMWMAKNKFAPTRQVKWLVIILMFLYAIERNFNNYPLMIDCVLALLIVQVYQLGRKPGWVIKPMSFLGKHSMNIFLFHTFIFGFWFQDFIYASRNPIIILLTLLAVCIPISMLLEYIKRFMFYRVVR